MVQGASVLNTLDPVHTQPTTPTLTTLIDEGLSKLTAFGLGPITDRTLARALETFLEERVPCHFYVGSASPPAPGESPLSSKDPCRLLTNTWTRCWLAPKLAGTFTGLVADRSRTLDANAIDVVLTATIIADTFMWTHDGRWNEESHVLDAAKAWNAHLKDLGLATSELPMRAMNTVLWHHGTRSPRWIPGLQVSSEVHLGHLVHAVHDLVAEGFPGKIALS